MPLSATLQSQLVNASSLPEDDWQLLRRPDGARQICLRCCGQGGTAADLPETAVRVFRHLSGSNCPVVRSRSEGTAHLLLRHELAAGAIDAGWQVDPDHGDPEEGYGVLAAAGRRRVLFQVVPGAPAAETIIGGQKLYQASGIDRVIWVTRAVPPELVSSRIHPVFNLLPVEGQHHLVGVSNLRLDPADFAKRGLSGGVRFAAQASPSGPQEVPLYAGTMPCRGCGATSPVVRPDAHWLSSCGRTALEVRLRDLPMRSPAALAMLADLDPKPRIEFGVGNGWDNRCLTCARPLPLETQPVGLVASSGRYTKLGTLRLSHDELSELRLPSTGSPHWCAGVPLCPQPPS